MKNWRVVNKECNLGQSQLLIEYSNILAGKEALNVWLYQNGRREPNKCS
ncbi:MAG: hypothetical protein JNK69_09715 [Saprospiraceae bacterium]|nr:hypothetical protein [Saprospiraceae bacterium]MCC6841883.1 hypothetical protein [Saprospiraceae bacterium]